MRNRLEAHRSGWIVAAGLVLALTALFAVPEALSGPASAGKVTYAKGKIEVMVKDGWKSVSKGSQLFGGQTVRTGKKSKVEIRLADGSVVRLGSRSKFKLVEAAFGKEGHKQFDAKLYRGQAYAVATKLVGKESSFKMSTSNAVAGVRGTTFRIDAKRDKSSVVRVYTGAVAVSNAPLYAKPGKPKDASGKFQMPRKGVKPGGPGRVVVAGPQQVTKKQWEEIVAKAMQEVTVAADGKMSTTEFSAEAEAEDDWVAWNKSRDKQLAE